MDSPSAASKTLAMMASRLVEVVDQVRRDVRHKLPQQVEDRAIG